MNQPLYKTVTAKAPATVANVACGFDIFGFAVDSPADEVTVETNPNGGLVVSGITGDDNRLPREAASNTATVAINCFCNSLGIAADYSVFIAKKLPLGSGMGSSASSSVAALLAINHMVGEPLTRRELLPFAMEAERIACGSAHADNVAPALLGGFIVIRGYQPLDTLSIPVPDKLHCTLVYPHIEVKTSDSRRVLRSTIPLKDAIVQGGNIAGLVIGFMQSDYDLISRSLHDVIAEPVRSMLIPGFAAAKSGAMHAGALGCSISGSGPTLFCLSDSLTIAQEAGKQMREAFSQAGLNSDLYISKINTSGGEILEAK